MSLVHPHAEAKKTWLTACLPNRTIAPRSPATISAHLASVEQFVTYTILRAQKRGHAAGCEVGGKLGTQWFAKITELINYADTQHASDVQAGSGRDVAARLLYRSVRCGA